MHDILKCIRRILLFFILPPHERQKMLLREKFDQVRNSNSRERQRQMNYVEETRKEISETLAANKKMLHQIQLNTTMRIRQQRKKKDLERKQRVQRQMDELNEMKSTVHDIRQEAAEKQSSSEASFEIVNKVKMDIAAAKADMKSELRAVHELLYKFYDLHMSGT